MSVGRPVGTPACEVLKATAVRVAHHEAGVQRGAEAVPAGKDRSAPNLHTAKT